MTVVLAAVPIRRPLLDVVDDELLDALGVEGVQHLDHLMDGRPVYIPALFAGPWPMEDARRSPRVRFVVGEIRRNPLTSQWCGPVLIETAAGVAAYIQPAYLAHQACDSCLGVWSDRSGEVSAKGSGYELFRIGLMPGASGPLEVLTHTRDLASRLGEQTILVARPVTTRLVLPA
ncbi:hypothetical protein [Lapillicoccus sp.]|uniref:hypothetical protein n=1 Tax=Lapillicoccus sp. TaxID=1909287 RepID=UPI0025F2BCB8|nr:hypothetical protein [Lapillicoccus sp.]